MFDGADVVPMDVDEADRQRLLSDLEAYRRDHKDDAGPEPPAQAVRSPAPERAGARQPLREPHKTAVVVDTNFLIANLSLLRKTVDVMPSDMFIMVPLTVLRELDGLKKSARDTVNHDDIKGRLRVSLGDCARQANLFLHKVFSSNSPLFRGQSVSDVREGAEQTGISNDDRILECCLFCAETITASVTLLSNDKNLCVKAMMNSISTICDFRGNHTDLVAEIRAQAKKRRGRAGPLDEPAKETFSPHSPTPAPSPHTFYSGHPNPQHVFSHQQPTGHTEARFAYFQHQDSAQPVFVQSHQYAPFAAQTAPHPAFWHTGHDQMSQSPFSVMHSSAPSDAFHGGDGGMDVDPDDSEHATYPVPLEPPPQVQLAESRQAAALSQLEMTFYGCMHACIPVLLQKAFGDKWQERSGARDPPADVAGQISLIEQHSAEFQGLISRDVLSSLGQARRMAMDLRRSVRQNKVMLTRGDLALFLRDAESLMLESCRVCRFVESEARVRREMQAVRNELGAGLA
ncbi:hypothetical protein HK105_207428 [Polyrhizophydium stewartii]|uniref:PIN domain-containing protein n=1 Tax=Polyrhizophydium stewartii TaxID=2732419 RepID=A0ABR4N0T3_9FUNG